MHGDDMMRGQRSHNFDENIPLVMLISPRVFPKECKLFSWGCQVLNSPLINPRQ